MACNQTLAGEEAIGPPEKDYGGENEWGNDTNPNALIPINDEDGWDGLNEDWWADWQGWWGFFGADPHVESPGALRGTDIYHHPESNLPCTEREPDEENTEDCPEASMRANSVEPSGTDGPCGLWSGPGIAATVCDSKTLSRSLSQGKLALNGQFRMSIEGRKNEIIDTAPGLAQIAGRPLHRGEVLRLHAVRNGDRVVIKTLTGHRVVGAAVTLHNVPASGNLRISVGLNGHLRRHSFHPKFKVWPSKKVES